MRIHSVRPVHLLLALLAAFVLGLLVSSQTAGALVSMKMAKDRASRVMHVGRSAKTSPALSRAAEARAAKRKADEARRHAAAARRKAADATRRAHAVREAAFRARLSRYGLSWPRADIITSGFGPRKLGGYHHGIDILCGRKGLDPIYSAGNGRIVVSSMLPIYGRAVIIEHPNKITTVYGHLSSSWVRPGQQVRRGQPLGRCGSTGRSTAPHLHFEVHTPAGVVVNPLRALPPR